MLNLFKLFTQDQLIKALRLKINSLMNQIEFKDNEIMSLSKQTEKYRDMIIVTLALNSKLEADKAALQGMIDYVMNRN